MSVHLVETPQGRKYKVRWREGGRNRARHFDRHKDAQLFDSEVRRRRQAGDLILLTSRGVTVADYAATWWETYAEPDLSPRTLEVYAFQLDLRILPMLGGYRLREVTPAVVREFMAQMRSQEVADASIVKTCTVLQSMLALAVIDGLITRNPVAVVRKPPQRRKRDPDLVPPATVERIRAKLKQRDATLVSVLAYAGLRPESEAVTLTWRQIGERSMRIQATKTGRQRQVRLLAPLVQDLTAWRKTSPGRGLVFPASNGVWTRDDWRNWLRRIYRPAAKAAGLPADTRPRDLRGSFASLLIWEGMNVVEVAQQLGHSAQTCLRDYAGVFEEFTVERRVPAEESIRKARSGVPMRLAHEIARRSE